MFARKFFRLSVVRRREIQFMLFTPKTFPASLANEQLDNL